MCLAVYKPAGLVIPASSLVNGFLNNSDGAGFAYVAKGKVNITKGLMTYKDFIAAYEAAFTANKKSPFLIHFRIRTMGFRDADNTHPYRLPNGGALIHNGGIDGTGAIYNEGKSDTALFIEQFGQYLTYKNVEKYKASLEDVLSWNKLAMLYPDGKHHIINEKAGTWTDDIWYSNHTFKSRPAYAPQAPYGMIDDTDWGDGS